MEVTVTSNVNLPVGPGSATGIVRILNRSELHVGLGFLIDNRTVITAAHVVNLSLGRGELDQSTTVGRKVYVEFILLAQGIVARRATVVTWAFSGLKEVSGDDVAALKLEEQAPNGAAPLRLNLEPSDDGVMLFGPVQEQSQGAWVNAHLMEAVAGGRIQVNHDPLPGGVHVRPEWSGGPVWHRPTQSVYGMLVARPIDEDRCDVYALPCEAICRAYPEGLGYLLVTGGTKKSEVVPSVGAQLSADADQTAASLHEITNRVNSLEERFSQVTKAITRIANNLDRLERLSILPNYEIPRRSDLLTLEDLLPHAEGKRVLVKLDIDVASALGNPGSEHKFVRASRTIRELVAAGARVILLAGQGLTAVTPLEPNSAYALDIHAEILARELQGVATLKRITLGPDLGSRLDQLDSTSVALLPNLPDISPEDVLISRQAERNPQREMPQLADLCEHSRLVQLLQPHYDAFVLDDFRSTVTMLPSNIGLSAGKDRCIGRGIEADLDGLERLLATCVSMGKRSTSKRIVITGSSRPDDILVVETFLQARLFDECLLGPYGTLMVLLRSGVSLSASLLAELAELAALNGRRLESLLAGAAGRLATEYVDRLVLAKDFLVRRNGRSEVMDEGMIAAGALSAMTESDQVTAIGPATVQEFRKRIASSELVFHFGMLGRNTMPEVDQTKAVMRTYCEAGVESYLAGDHVTALAYEMGLSDRLQAMITGAQTTSFYMTGVSLPGLVPFLRARAGI